MIRDKTGLVVCHWFADEMDQVLRGLFQQAITTLEQEKIFKQRMAILALGGYGRRELCLYSDVDLLFVFRGSPSPEEEQFVKSLIYPLWDIGIDLGHATRDLKGSLEVVGQDLNSATALIDNRWLGGNEDLRMELTEAMHKRLHAKSNAEWYVEAKLDEFVRRHEKHGNSIYVLEPNVKDGCGGLGIFIASCGWRSLCMAARRWRFSRRRD